MAAPPFPDDSGSRDDSERLDELERRLRRNRPQSVPLDASVIWEAAERTGSVTLEHPVAYRRADRARRPWPALAGSWLCGAVVGAVASWALVARTPAPPIDDAPGGPEGAMATSVNPAPTREPLVDGRSQDNPIQGLAMTDDAPRGVDRARRLDAAWWSSGLSSRAGTSGGGGTLRAGGLLTLSNPWTPLAPMDMVLSATSAPAVDAVPSPESPRQDQLLRELLGEFAGDADTL